MNFKKFVSIALVSTIALGLLAGCGGPKKNANVIQLGIIAEMTGNNASYGNSIANGAKMAAKELNAKGGLLGKQVEFVVADTKSEPAESANAMSKLVNQNKVPAVLGLFASSGAIAAANVSEASKIPFLAVGATNPKVTVDDKSNKVKPNTYRVCFIDPFQGTVGANFVADTLKFKKAAILIDNSSDYSKGLADCFKKAFAAKGGSIVIEESYLQKDTDFKSVLTKMAAVKPEVIYVPGYYEEIGKIVKQAREIGLNVPFVGGDGWDSPKLVEIAGAKALNNTYFTNHYSADDTSAASKAFVDAYQKEYKQRPDACAVLGYDAANILFNAIKTAGDLTPAKISQAIAATKNFAAVTGNISLNENHDAVKSAVIIEYKDGKQAFKATVKP
ncbi:MAG: ABC transporter substrate-binding protein [Acidaminococcaceae bacterium]|jgi:branched-chain amino acid transport system substrate-binding protein|nr:ABC transporter substrate-binding protein [Acidaminococcaceae bacterium]